MRHVLAGLVALAAGGRSAGAQDSGPVRPPATGLQANVVFLYYRDLPAAQ